jgi:hypothetical protein
MFYREKQLVALPLTKYLEWIQPKRMCLIIPLKAL